MTPDLKIWIKNIRSSQNGHRTIFSLTVFEELIKQSKTNDDVANPAMSMVQLWILAQYD